MTLLKTDFTYKKHICKVVLSKDFISIIVVSTKPRNSLSFQSINLKSVIFCVCTHFCVHCTF